MQRGGVVLLGKVLPIVAAEAGVRRSGYSESDKVYYVNYKPSVGVVPPVASYYQFAAR